MKSTLIKKKKQAKTSAVKTPAKVPPKNTGGKLSKLKQLALQSKAKAESAKLLALAAEQKLKQTPHTLAEQIDARNKLVKQKHEADEAEHQVMNLPIDARDVFKLKESTLTILQKWPANSGLVATAAKVYAVNSKKIIFTTYHEDRATFPAVVELTLDIRKALVCQRGDEWFVTLPNAREKKSVEEKIAESTAPPFNVGDQVKIVFPPEQDFTTLPGEVTSFWEQGVIEIKAEYWSAKQKQHFTEAFRFDYNFRSKRWEDREYEIEMREIATISSVERKKIADQDRAAANFQQMTEIEESKPKAKDITLATRIIVKKGQKVYQAPAVKVVKRAEKARKQTKPVKRTMKKKPKR